MLSFGAIACFTINSYFYPSSDFGAHAGGAVQGILLGFILFGNELGRQNVENVYKSRIVVAMKIFAIILSIFLFIYSLYYMIEILKIPSPSSSPPFSSSN
jgi:hypothetical protein